MAYNCRMKPNLLEGKEPYNKNNLDKYSTEQDEDEKEINVTVMRVGNNEKVYHLTYSQTHCGGAMYQDSSILKILKKLVSQKKTGKSIGQVAPCENEGSFEEANQAKIKVPSLVYEIGIQEHVCCCCTHDHPRACKDRPW